MLRVASMAAAMICLLTVDVRSAQPVTPNANPSQARICAASVATMMGRPIEIISVRMAGTEAFASYRAGGKTWEYICRFEGQSVVWAAIIEGARGRWRTHPLDPKITWSTRDGGLQVVETYPDGSRNQKDFALE